MTVTLNQALDAYRRRDYSTAERLCRKALSKTADPDALNLYGACLLLSGRDAKAIQAFSQALELRDEPSAHHNLATALDKVGRHAEAVPHYRAALDAAPTHAAAMSGLGNALRCLGDLDSALQWQRRARELAPKSAAAHHNLAVTLSETGDYSAAEIEARRALDLQLDHPEAQFLLAEICLRSGRWMEGWNRYEHRFRLPGRERPRLLVPPGLPAWNGEPINKALLLAYEQGYGDAFHFVRFVKQLVVTYSAVVDVIAPPEISEILATAPGVRKVITKAPPARDYSAWCPLASLPRILGTTPDTLPTAPYLTAALKRTDEWRGRLTSIAGERRRVGIVWAGNPNQTNDRNRSITLAQLAPLAAVPGVHFFAFQKGPRTTDLPPDGLAYTPLGGDLTNFSDTAAALSALDLFISTDTSVPNLAGALGLPTWLMLGTPADWRWGTGEGTSQWYPSIRRYRQNTRGDWAGLVARIATDLVCW